MFKKLLSIALSAVTMVELIPRVPAIAEEAERYPYVFFASSEEDNAITINSNNICINGNIAANGTISSNAQYFNVNGTKTEHADEDPVLFFSKIESTYFKSHVETYFEDYFLNETNINVNIPIEVEGNIELNGNINITSGIKALNDITLSGNVENAYDSVICAETGDININTENINLNGLVYAPKGCVNITAQNLNINGVIIIADTIIINCPNLNANYNANMAEFIGSKNVSENDEELEIAAYGGQKNESDVYNIYWNTTIPDGTFDVQISDNGEEYSSIGNVVNTDSLEYHFTETFEKRYIKVVQTANDGKTSESVPFIVSYTENGFDTKFLDSDEDGLSDIYELKIGTDINSSDTDNDGLSDFREYVFTQTDPLIYDSVTKGIPDSDIDSDEDGLSNIDEFTRGTSPCNSDSDNDGLSDYDEIYIYNTDPLNSDSDGDGINDNSEIKLELDPNNASTNGIPDNEYVIPQNIEANSSVFSSINSEDSPYQLSVDILTNRDAENELEVNKSAYSAVIENDAMIGSSIDVDISDTCEPEKIVLKYDISEDYVQNRLNKYSSFEELQGIKRLNVFKFDEEQKMLKPVETEFDVSNDQLYAEVNETGTYCLMDMEIWFDELGVEIDEDTSDEETSTSYSLKLDDHVSIMSQESPKTYEFDGHKYEIIDHMDLTWSEAKEYCENIGGHLLTIASVQEQEFVEKNILVNAAKNAYWLGGYKDYNTWKWITGEHFFYSNWFKGINENQPDNWGGLEDKLSIYRLNNPKHKGKSANYWNDLNDSGIVGSESFFGVENIGFICEWESTAIPTEEYTLYYANNWKKVNLRGKLSPDNKIDSDGDTLTDWEEVDTSRLTWHSDGSFEFLRFNLSDVLTEISRFNKFKKLPLIYPAKEILYVPVLSDPSLVDTDGDGLDDEEETYYNTKQISADTDGDNLSDGEEIDLWFDPTDPNPDGDSYDDEEEKDNNTNPFVYDLNFEEAGEEWSKGVLLGDLETADNVPALLGHITGSFIPYIDGRDFIANVKNGDYKAAALNLFGLALDIFTGPIGAAYDVTKGFTKLSRFAAKYSDDAPKVVQAVTKASEYFPDAEKVIPDLAKVLPASALDDLADSVKNGDKITKSDYQKLSKIFEASGRDADEICGFIAKNADEINFKPEKLMDELIHSGKKFTLDKVEFVVKNSDGELMWLEYGDESKGLYHILYGSSKKAGHLKNFADRGIKDVKSFMYQIAQSTPIEKGERIGKNGRIEKYAQYVVDEQKYLLAYGENGFIVSFYPI